MNRIKTLAIAALAIATLSVGVSSQAEAGPFHRRMGWGIGALATGLVVGGAPETLKSGVLWSEGCVPHACGRSDSFMAIDPKAEALYFAQQTDGKTPNSWPPAATWPKDVIDAMTGAIGR